MLSIKIRAKYHAFFLRILLITNFLFFCLIAQAQDWIIKYDSDQRSVRCFTVTYEKNNQFGTVWWPKKLDLSQPLELNFVIYLGRLNGNGADGMGFVLHDDARGFDAIGDKGGGLGFGMHPSHNKDKITPSLGIEFDTWYNGNCGSEAEIREDHTTVVYNGDMCNPQFKPVPIKPAAHYAIQNVEDNKCYDYKITWTPNTDSTQTITFSIDGHHVFTYRDSIISEVFKGKTEVFYGFTGSTGGAMNEQTVCLLGGNTNPFAVSDYAETYTMQPVDINITANDYDPDGDQLDTINILKHPLNGVVDVINNDSIRYTPNLGFSGYDSLKYVTCDINSFKCYAKCDTATVLILVKCGPYQVSVEKVQDNTKCADSVMQGGVMVAVPDNGFARAYIDNNGTRVTADFTFRWINPDGTIFSGVEYTSMAAGTYKVVAVSNLGGCVSDTSVITINNNIPLADMDISVVHSLTSCKTDNGELQARVMEGVVDVTADYDITWYPNSQRYINIIGVGSSVAGLSSQTYYAEGLSNISGCRVSAVATIDDHITYPEVNISRVDHIFRCDYPYGNMNAEVTVTGVPADPSYFTFEWFTGNVAQSSSKIYSESGSTIDSLNAGFYTVKVVTDSSGCESVAKVDEVLDQTDLKNVEISLVAEQTSCATPNGALAAAVNGSTSGFTFEWFTGNNTTTAISAPAAIASADGSQAINLESITYTVKATETATGCVSTDTFTVPENLLNITVSPVIVSHQTNCWPHNGEISASASGGLSGEYDHYWFNNNPGTNPDTTTADYKGNIYSGLITGDYWVVATDKYARCKSTAVQIDINPPAPLPDVVFSYSPNATCDPAFPNGTITADIVGAPESGYDIRWYVGQTTNNSFRLPNAIIPTAQIQGSNDEILINLPDQIFTVRIRDNNTNCSDTAVAIVPLGTPPAITASTSSSPVTRCSPFNGAAQANVAGSTAGFTFEWYRGENVKTAPDYTGSNINNLEHGWYTVVATDNNTKCVSDPVTDSVQYQPGIFITSIQETSGVSSCISEDGILQVNHSGGTGPFGYQWYRGNSIEPANQIGSSQIVSNLKQGLYTAFVTDQHTSCSVKDTFRLSSSNIIPVLTTSVLPFTHCITPNGEASANVVGVSDQSQFTFFWFSGNSVKLDGSPDGYAEEFSDQTWTGLTAGEYTVIARQNFGNQCESHEVVVTVVEEAMPPAIVIASNANTNCASPFNGTITAKAQTANGHNQPAGGYEFSWHQSNYSGLAPANAIEQQIQPKSANDTIDHSINSLTGNLPYTVIVTNMDTQCKDTVQHNLQNNLTYPYFITHIKQDIIQCGSNGSIEINDLSYGATTDFTYQWYYQDMSLPALADIDNQITGLDTGLFFVTATDQATLCESNPLEVRIDDLREYPSASLSILHEQISLNPSYFTGELLADAIEQDGTVMLYNFDWFFNGSSFTNTTGVADDIQSNLQEGKYTAVATNTTTNCSDSARIDLPLNPPPVQITSAIVVNNTWCNPENGSINVTAISRDNQPDNLMNYRYFFYHQIYDADTANANYVLDGGVTTTIANLSPGTWFITAFEKTLHLKSLVYEVSITDESVLPAITLDTLIAQTSCDSDVNNHNGAISVEIDGGVSPSGYTVSWHTGKTSTGVSLSNSISVTGLSENNYTVRIVNNTSGCVDEKTYFVPSNLPEFTITSSSAPNTNCINPNGDAFINVLNNESHLFNYLWYTEGSSIDPQNPSFSGQYHDNLAGGNYVAVAQYINDLHCLSNQVNVRIDDILKYPEVYIQLDHPLTNCDPLRPNGQLSVQSDHDVINHLDFAWFAVANPVDTLSTNRIIQELPIGSYFVSATFKSTGCQAPSQPFDMTEDIAPVEPPLVQIITEMKSCIYPDGSASAYFEEKSNANYNFRWFDSDGNELPSLDVNYLKDSLEAGNYQVSAIDRQTGCESPKTSFSIADQIVYPEFEVVTHPATCDQKDGIAQLMMLNNAADESFIYNAETNELIGTVPIITEMSAGDYEVEVVSQYGCMTTKSFTLGSNIKVFNGVSDNGDMLNDWFVIDCIDDFPANHVKIFNRSGTLVFETENYDNKENNFRGQGNRGLYLGMSDLPVGTYFYVIDLKDASKPVTGFLELVR